MEMDNKRQVQRKRAAEQQLRQKAAAVLALSVFLFILIIAGLVKVILDEKKAGENGIKNQTEETGSAASTETSGTVAGQPTLTVPPPSESAPKVIIDPGHGGDDYGCVRQELYEKNANLAIALQLQKILLEEGYQVYMIRDTDVSVENRTRPETALEQKGDIYVSIHLNSLEEDDESTTGAEVWYSDMRADDSETLARYVADELTAFVGMENRGVKVGNNLTVLRYNGIPACLVECGFMTSTEERAKLFDAEYQKKLAEGIAAGIKKFLPVE